MSLGGEHPVRLRGVRDVYLTVSEECETVPPRAGERTWRLKVRSYWYYLYADVTRTQEILAYHWHPDAVIKHAHLHPGPAMMRGLDWVRTLHLPTGEVAIGDFIAMLITDFGVRPLRSDWERVLEPVRAGN